MRPQYGDQGSDTLGHIARRVPLARADAAGAWSRSHRRARRAAACRPARGRGRTHGGSIGRQGLGHRSLGNDGRRARPPVSGVSRRLSRRDDLREFSRLIGRGVIGNKAASGTAIIDELGAEHMRTGALIVYTSADSVFQIAAHEAVVPVSELVSRCEIAYALVGEGLGVARVIARPFVGEPGHVQADRQSPRLRAAAAGRDAARSADRRRRFRWSRSARSTISSPAAASRRANHTASDDEGMDRSRAADARGRSRPDLRQSRRLRHPVRAPQRRRGLRGKPRTVRSRGSPRLLPELRDDDRSGR